MGRGEKYMPPALDTRTPIGFLAHKALQDDHTKRFACSQVEHQEIHSIHEEAKEIAEAPRMGMDMTATQWDQWRSSWAVFKHHYTRPHDCRYLLPCDCDCGPNLLECLSPQLRTAAHALEDSITIGEEQLLVEVRKLAITNTSRVTMTPAGEVSAKDTIATALTAQEANTRDTLVKTP